MIEEAFDEWVVGRMDFGQHITFEDRWERELEDTIRRDYSHTSIIMWSTGNQALNMAYDTFAEGRDLWGPGTEGDFAPLNVAGYNYKVARYEYDGENFRTGSSTALRPTPGPRCKAVRPSSAAPRDRRFCLKTGRDVLQTAGETAALVMVAVPRNLGGRRRSGLRGHPALDANGIQVFDETGEVAVRALGGGELLALGVADPKPDRSLLFSDDCCPMFEGTAMVVICGERGTKGCMVEVSLGGVTAQLPIGFTSVEEPAAPVHDVKLGPLGELMADPGTMEVLKTYLAPIVDNPMASAEQGQHIERGRGAKLVTEQHHPVF